MHLHSSQLFADDIVERVPASNVATALDWLGHDSCGTCPQQVHEPATAWLISAPSGHRPSGMRALMDIEFLDPPWSPAEGLAILAKINLCTSRDRIQVELRDGAERLAINASNGAEPMRSDLFSVGREMRLSGSGMFDVLIQGVVLANQVPFETAHEFVHTNCLLCKTGEDHTKESVGMVHP